MGILDEDVAKVRELTDIVALVSEHVALKRAGRQYAGLCPFHQEKSASFSVNPEMGVYYCFGCQASGDAITFIREIEHLDFVEAVERLAARANITLRYDDRATQRDRSRKDRLSECVAAAIDFYHQRLLTADDAGRARGYLRSRGFDGDAVRRFLLGWAPDDWDELSRHLQKRSFARADIVDAGLAFVNRVNKLQDQFRNRLMFPIHDQRGVAVGFGGRALDDQGPKYKNSPETPLYQKSRLLYGLQWAKAEIVARSEVVICEGYTDVMAFALAGAPNAVATCGTALADDHVRLLKNFARHIVLAYDADAAGQGAAEPWYRWEHEFDLEVRVADLPPGKDPADVFLEDRQALLDALARAAPFLQFRLDRLLAAADRTTLEGRGRAGEAAAAIIAEHPSGLVRDQYVMKLAGELQLSADRLREEVTRIGRPRGDERARRRPSAAGESRPPSSLTGRDVPTAALDAREVDVLRRAVHEPSVVADWIEGSLFANPITREAYECLESAATFHDAVAHAGGPARSLLERLAVEIPEDADEPAVVKARLLANAVEPAAARLLTRLAREGDERWATVKRELDQLVQARASGEWSAAQETALRLLGWVAHDASGVVDREQAGASTNPSET